MYNWKTLNESLPKMTEQEVLDALNNEVKDKKRWTIIKRLHQRFCAMRANRERVVFLKLCGKMDDPKATL